MYVPSANDVEGARDVMVDADHVRGPCVLTQLFTGGCAWQGVRIPLRGSHTPELDGRRRRRQR